MKKILFINPHFPLFSTPTCGGANRSQMFLRALTEVGHVDVVSFWENEISNIPNCDVIHSGCPEIGPTDSYGRIEKFIRLLAPWNANNIFPLNRSVEAFCDEWIAKGDYDYIAVRYLFTAAEYGLLKYADRLIVDVDDNPKNTLLVRAQKAQTKLRRLYLRLASVSANLMTRFVLQKVYCSFYSNLEERPSHHSTFLHNVSAQNKPLPPISDATPMRVLVVGRWAYYPNQHGLQLFLTQIWPEIRKNVPDAELVVVGGNMNEFLEQLCHQTEGVVVKGFVDDIMREYQNARCVIVPIYYGGGTCVKVIETMSVNRPFVSTKCGVRGLDNDIKSGRDYLFAKDDVSFAQSVISLLQNPQLGISLAENAMICADEKFSVRRFNEIIKEAICI